MDQAAYLAVRQRLIPLVRAADPQAPVPACPAWLVRDVVAHLAGLCEDWVRGRLDNYASDAWTAAQIERVRGRSLDDIMQRWAESVHRFTQLENHPVMGPPARWAFGDAIIHEADLRGAVGAARVPPEAVLLALRGSIGRWRQTLGAVDAPSLHLQALDARDWWLGSSDDPRTVTIRTSAYEVFRALAGRRSATQVRAWDWSGDPEPYLSIGPPYPFHWAAEDLHD